MEWDGDNLCLARPVFQIFLVTLTHATHPTTNKYKNRLTKKYYPSIRGFIKCNKNNLVVDGTKQVAGLRALGKAVDGPLLGKEKTAYAVSLVFLVVV